MCHSNSGGIDQTCMAAVLAMLALIGGVGCADRPTVDPVPGINGSAVRLAADDSSTVRHENVDFNEALSDATASGKTLIVDFGATRCPPCRMLKPEMEKVSQRAQEEAIVLTVDVDAEPGLAAHFQVGAIPDIRFFRMGKAAGGVVGFHTADEIISNIPSP
jgi:thioredoxin 1